jgi:D-aspartate ligase
MMGKNSYHDGALIIGGDFHGLGIARNLEVLGIPVFVVDPGFCIARFSRLRDAFFKCPPLADTEAFIDFLMKLATSEKLGKTVLFPVSDTAVHILSKYRNKLEQQYLVPTPAWEITKLAYDKKLTYQIANEIGIPIPKTYFPENEEELSKLELDFPVILKPAITSNFYPVSHLKAIRSNNHKELLRNYRYMFSIIDKSEIMVQEIIGGGPKNLYSFCSLFGNGAVKAKIMAVRLRQHPMDFGSSSTYVITCTIPQLEELSTRILRHMNYYGLSEVEFMFDERDDTFKLIDINPRTWAWHTLGAKAGVNFSALLFRDMHNDPVQLDSFESGVIWIRELTDIPTAATEIVKKRLKVTDYLGTLKGKKELAVFSRRDPLPFVVELFQGPYMWCKRGFRL